MTVGGEGIEVGCLDINENSILHRHWYVSTGECLNTMTGHTASVDAVLISSDGSKAISGSLDTTVRVWNTDCTSRCVIIQL